MTEQNFDGVAKASDAVAAAELRRRVDRDFYGGQDEVWAATTTHLPLLEGEDAQSSWGYAARLKRSRVVPYMTQAVTFAEGQVFQKSISWGGDVPVEIRGQVGNKDDNTPEVLGWMENIDLQGRNGWRFFRQEFVDKLVNGFALWVADTPPSDGPKTVGEDKRRPYLVRYHPSTLLDVRWHFTPDGRKRLEHVRMFETAEEADPADQFGRVKKERVRVYDSPTVGVVELSVYEKGANGKWFLLADYPRTIDGLEDIPVTIDGDPFGVGIFHQLAHLNGFLYRKESDRSTCEFYCVPQPYIANLGAQYEEVKLGIVRSPDRVALFSDEATLGFWQADPEVLDQMGRSVDSLKAEIREESLKAMTEQKSGDPTATEAVLNAGQNISRLQALWIETADAIEQSLVYLSQLGGLGDDGGSIDKERTWVDLRPDQVKLEWIKALKEFGVLSLEGVFEIAKRERAIPEDMEYATERERIAQQGDPLGMIGEGPRTLARVKQLMAEGVPADEAMARAEAELHDPPEIGVPPAFGAAREERDKAA